MKYFFLIITALVMAGSSFAQTETTVWNGKTYYVYPHQLELQHNMYIFMQYAEFKEVLKRDDKNQKVIRTEIKKIDEDERLNRGYNMRSKMTKEQKQQEKFIIELLNKKPDLFYQYGSNLSQDVTPALTSIPDGEYIQYYRDLPYLDNNILRFKNDVVAGVFTVKNNQLDGLATWYTVNGMVIKSGNFAQGSRHGSWFFNSYTPKRNQEALNQKPEKAIEFLLNNVMQYDTTVEHYNYNLGLRSGAYSQKYNDFTLTTGSYKDDKESGTWDFFDFSYVLLPDGTYRITDTLVNTKHFTYVDKPVRGKGIILRDEVVAQEFMYGDYGYYGDEEEDAETDTSLVLYNTFSSNGYFESFSSFYTILGDNDANEEGLELPEEGINSYEGEEYEGMSYPGYDDYGYYGDYPYEGSYDFDYNQQGSQFINGKFYTRNQLIDSVGYEFFYDGVYEEHYGNGQLKFRFEIKDGNLVSEDTVFWENGNAANTIAFDETTRQYTQHFFDYKGKLYKTVLFDEKGEEIRDSIAEEGVIIIDGLPYYSEGEYEYTTNVAYYNARDKLNDTLLTERTLIQAGRWLRDSTLFMTGYLDPQTRVLDFNEYNVMGTPYVTQKATFGEEYENVNALTNTTVGKLRLETLTNGSLYDFSNFPFMYNSKADSALPQSNALYWSGNYETTSDEVLYVNDKPFNGSFSVQTDASKYSLSVGDKAISLKLPETADMQKQMRKALKKYYKKGKRNAILELYNSDVQYGGTDGVFYALFPSMSYIFSLTNYNPYGEYGYDDYMYYEEFGYDQKKKNKIEYPFDKTLSGQFLNGKPEGEWIVKDQFGNITARVNYVKGEREGESVFYATEFPITETQRNYQQEYVAEYHTYIFESLPEKKTQYLSRREFYHNGLLEGPVVSFNWKGDTLSYDVYHDGLQNGISYQRNKIFYAETVYEDGAIDGISRTFLTLPGRDSILIFDLNFQNGALQGESKSYHTNGKLAKRGFFLTGQPIDDYEAFDTLGFKYQYVKFQYNQPVEEKIWEENQLSVRYLFDWKDSIPFQISDIAGSTSFERLATDMGLIQNPYSEPYYGRPSLVDKTGINYNITKYYPNDTVARYGNISKGKKVGLWKHFSYEGKALYEANYFDTILQINDSIRFKSKGILTLLDDKGKPSSKSYIIEKVEKYDCSHADHNEERMLYTFWEADTSQHRINGYVKNYYDNGAIQNEGNVVDGLPTGTWKMYDSDGQLNQVGNYKQGKRDGRWLSGDLSNVKNMSEICLNPNLENLEEIMSYQEKLLDVSVIYYGMGKILKREYYGINLNNGEAPEYYREDDYYRE